MKLLLNYAPIGLCLAMVSGALNGRAATVWTGPATTFVNPAGSDPTLPSNQDRLTTNVWITRAVSEGIFNAKTETSFAHFFSPADTAWADGTTANYLSLSFTDWDTWAKNLHGGPPSTIGVDASPPFVRRHLPGCKIHLVGRSGRRFFVAAINPRRTPGDPHEPAG